MVKRLTVSSIPGIKSKINLTAVFTLSYLAVQATYAILEGITLLKAIVYLIGLGLNALLVYNLYVALKPDHTFDGLDVINKLLKVLFIFGCVVAGFFGLLVLLCIILLLIGGARSGEMWTCIVLMAIPTAQVFISLQYYRHISKLAGQLKNDGYDASEAPETWAIISAASFLVYLLVMLILTYAAPTVIEADQAGGVQGFIARLADTITKRSDNMLIAVLKNAEIVLHGAARFAVYLLLKTIRHNLTVSKKSTARKR